MKIEKRFTTASLRAEESGGKTYLVGRAASFNVVSHDLGGFREKLAPGCFDDVLADRSLDCIHSVNHDPNRILGRTTSGTLKLKSDAKGLNYRTELPDTGYADDVAALCKRGDLNASSFAFTVDRDGETWDDNAEDADGAPYILRTITRIASLHDVATVANAAYPQTAAGLSRSLPASMPIELRNRILLRAADDDEDGKCDCNCPECLDGDCSQCSNPDCEDPNCERCLNSRGNRGDDPPTKKVDGFNLPASAFLVIGDEKDPETWKLPVHFPSLAESKKHTRLAVELFGTMKGVSEDEAARARQELGALAKKYGIEMDTDDDRAARDRRLELAMSEW
jgi:uncharacterized protein